MEHSKFNITISASPEKVWDTLWSETNYPAWTAPFCEGSHAVTDWKEGSKVQFLDDKQSGMLAIIEKNVPNKFMSIKALGEVVDGEVVYDSEGAKACAGSYENYTLTPEGNQTRLEVVLSGGAAGPEEFKKFLDTAWPKAIAAIKQIAEA